MRRSVPSISAWLRYLCGRFQILLVHFQSARDRYLLEQHLVRLRQIEWFGVRRPPAQISGGPVDFDHVAVRVVEKEAEGLVEVEYKLDRDLLLHKRARGRIATRRVKRP
jgi:hypothetical protein